MQSPSPRPTKPQIAVAADLNSRYNPPQPAAASPLSFRLIFQLEKRLGAFLAGLVVAGSEFRHQAMYDLIPAREVLASLFFVSVGMLLDVSDVFEHLMPTVGLLGAILVGKFAIVLGTALLLRLPLRVGILSAATLCQVGVDPTLVSPAAKSVTTEPTARSCRGQTDHTDSRAPRSAGSALRSRAVSASPANVAAPAPFESSTC